MRSILFLLPAIIVISITTVIPLLWNVYLSFTEWSGSGNATFVGLENYKDIFAERITKVAILNSLHIGIVATIVSLTVGVFFALILFFASKKITSAARIILYSPTMIPMTVLGLLFSFILAQKGGLLNSALDILHLDFFQRAWLSEKNLALWVIGIIQGWRTSGTIMILSYTAMLAIPQSLFEAADLEGAAWYDKPKFIILPIIKPTIRLAMSLTLVWAFKTYDLVWAMTRGGPAGMTTTAPIIMIKTAFSFNEYGLSAAIGIVSTLLIGLFIAIARKLLKGEVYEY